MKDVLRARSKLEVYFNWLHDRNACPFPDVPWMRWVSQFVVLCATLLMIMGPSAARYVLKDTPSQGKALFTERASSPIQQLARKLASMLQNPGDHLADPINGPHMALYQEALSNHQGTSQAETTEDVERLFEEAKSKRKSSPIRDIANQNPWANRNPDRDEIERALEALDISEKAPEWWDELSDEIEAIEEIVEE